MATPEFQSLDEEITGSHDMEKMNHKSMKYLKSENQNLTLRTEHNKVHKLNEGRKVINPLCHRADSKTPASAVSFLAHVTKFFCHRRNSRLLRKLL